MDELDELETVVWLEIDAFVAFEIDACDVLEIGVVGLEVGEGILVEVEVEVLIGLIVEELIVAGATGGKNVAAFVEL